MRIERDIINQFKVWKEVPDRKPILLRGARQIGKTWAMEAFGKECFNYYLHSSQSFKAIGSTMTLSFELCDRKTI